MATKSNPNYTLTGRITNPQREPLAGLTVRAYDQDPKSPDDFLGEATTDKDGRYQIRFTEAQFKPGGQESGGPDVYIVVLAGDEQVGRSEVRRNARREETISLQVEWPEPAESAYSVSGTVRQSDGRPFPYILVRAFDQGLRKSRSELGESKTGSDGRYTIGYEPEKLLDPERGSANLQIEVIPKEGANPVKSDIRYNARPLETINLTVDPDADKSEWERLQGRLRPALKGVAMEDLSDDELDFIAKSSRMRVEALRPVRAAAIAANKSQLPDWFHFALAQQGLPADGEPLLELPEARIQEALKAAERAKAIPRPSEKELNIAQERLQRLQADHALQKPLAGHRLSAQTWFELAGLPQGSQRQLARSLIGREPGLDGRISLPDDSGLTEEQLKATRLTLEMARLSDDHTGIVNTLRRDTRIQSLRDLARHYDPQDWEELAKAAAANDNSDLPDDLSDDDNGRATFARRLYTRAAAAYPTVATAYGLSRRKGVKQTHPAVALLPRIVEADAAFDLASTRLTVYINERREALDLNEEDAAKAAIDTLKGVQRLYRLRPEMPFIARLLEEPAEINGKPRTLDSAAAIVHVGKSQFIERYGSDAVFERETAAAVYHAAEKVAARVLGIYSRFNPAINTTPLPAAISDCPAALRGVPDWPALFGSLDGCVCEPCESVYSPAAYLTDLLAFLERHVQRASDADPSVIPANGLQALAERSFCNKDDGLVAALAPRRPDIANTLLSCRNAETELPYVDLALEIMENAVAPSADAVTLQTTLAAEQLAAQGEHFNATAYETLRSAIFPFSLPFDLWHEEETRYLDKLGTSRAELLETLFPFQTTDAPDQDPHDLTEIRRWQDREIARARLGMADNEWRLIAGLPIPPATAVFAAEPWGFSTLAGANWWHPLRNADVFLTRSGLTYEDMLRLFALRSFNPTGAIGIGNDSLGECDPKKIQLKGLNTAALGFLHRFLRLQRALGWSLRQLDQVLLALSPPSNSNARPVLNETFLVRLSHKVRLQLRFGLPLDELLSWWSPLDTRDYQVRQLPYDKVAPSLYDRLFLSGRAGEAEYEAFRLSAAGSELATPNEPVKNQLSVIAGAMRLPPADMEGLVNSLFTQLLFRGIWPEFDDSIVALAPGASVVPNAVVTWLSEKQVTLTPNARIKKDLEGVWKVTDGDIEYEFRKTATVLNVSKRTSPLLNLANLSLFFRHASLARALRLNIDDYLSLKALIGFDPFTAVHFSTDVSVDASLQTLRFVERAAMVADSGFSIAELDYLLHQTMPYEGKTLAPTEAWVQQSLNTLKAAVEAVSVSVSDEQVPMLHELQTNALALSLSEILALPVPVCNALLEHTRLPADVAQTAVTAFVAAFREQEEQDPSTGDQAESPATGSDDNANGAENDQTDTSLAEEQEPLVALVYRLHKAALVIGRLGIQAYELIDDEHRPRYLSMQATAGWLDVLGLPVKDTDTAAPYDAWMRTVRLFHFRDALLPEQQEYFLTLVDIAAEYVPGNTPFATEERRTYQAKLATLSGWSEEDLTALVGKSDIGAISHGGGGILQARFPHHFADERLPYRILTAIQFFKRLGASASAVEGWHVNPPGPLHTAARAARAARIKNALKARYGDGWAEALKPLRERQRQALVAYLLHEWNLERADDLFDHFLIDVEMSPCMMTSRLIQATAAVQLFVQRVLMKLEPGLALTGEGAEQWAWMKNYRVWEANRKVFLYPENWIEPELRDDKTPFFKDLENELLQADINNNTAETALQHYLEKLHEVARLQICGQYLDVNADGMTLHVFGRTRDVPHHYHYRRGILEMDLEGLVAQYLSWSNVNEKSHPPSLEGLVHAHWTPWERVDVDIEGDQLIPVVFNRRVYLFWPVYTSEDEAPLTHLTQQVMEIFGSVFRIQSDLTRRIGVDAMSAGVNAFIEVIKGIEGVINFIPLFHVVNDDGDSVPFELEDIREKLDDIKSDLETALFPPTNPPAATPTMESIFSDILTLLGTFEEHLIKLLPAKRLEVQLAWSEFKGDNWAAKKTSAGVVTFRDVISTLFESLPELPGMGSTGVKRLFTFRGEVDRKYNRLFIHCNVALPRANAQQDVNGNPIFNFTLQDPFEIGSFQMNGCSGTLEASDTKTDIPVLDLAAQAFDMLSRLAEDAVDKLKDDRQLQQRGEPVTPDDDPRRPSTLRVLLDNGNEMLAPIPKHFYPPYPLLSSIVEDTYRVLARHQVQGEKVFGFFYQDSSRAFLCLPWFYADPNPQKHSLGYIFFPFYHPYTCPLLENLQRSGIRGIYQDRYVLGSGGRPRLAQASEAGEMLQIVLQDEDFFKREYHPDNVVRTVDRALRPVEEFNFSNIGAYAQYNWEIFFYIPLLIANRLSTDQKFREAQHWFHYIFDPTDASRGEAPTKYWRTKPFVERSQADYVNQDIDQLLLLLSGQGDVTDLPEIERAVQRWREDAFNPHLIARTRTVAFQKTVVMKYIDNLIAWADSLFRREKREAVNEAMQLYILAAKLLGPRPRRIPRSAERMEKSFNELKEGLDAFSNALVELENHLAGTTSTSVIDLFWNKTPGMALADKGKLAGATLAPVGNAIDDLMMSPSIRDVSRQPGESGLYFCVPPNDKLLDKWDIVADRLFKIRHCKNIEGQTLTLSLLSPPIDPALLVRAKAMGMDIDSLLSQLQSPLPHYRFQTLAQKASELCGEVKALGSALLSALEKRDGEELSLLRTTHELRLLNAVQTIKEQQIKEAKCSLEGLQHSKEATEIRRDDNVRLRMEFMSPEEITSSVLGAASLLMQRAQVGAKFGSAAGGLVPNIKGGFVTTLGAMFGGQQIGDSAERAADAFGHIGSILSSTSGLVSTMGSYRRRADDWLLQITLAEKELEGLEKQICAAEIRVAVAEADLENHKLQIRNSQETQEFMQQKFTNQELYDWMVSQTSSLYFQSYQLAYDMARKAQQTFAFELGEEDPGIIRYGYWDSLKKGLLTGEHLYHDLKRLEVAYLDRNRREYELTKHVSLSSLVPPELIRLRETGTAEFGLPEALFDMDFPGHYMRRIKSVSLSIPCVTGPYSGVSATLRLQKSRVRWQPGLNPDYLASDDNDPRFTSLYTATRAIATSTGQNDSGLFELNLRDERFLPFEGEGVESLWELTINKAFAQFDLDTISDVVLHIRYTARDGGDPLRDAALDSLKDLQTAMTTIEGKPLPLTRLFSVRHEFPTEWARFKALTLNAQTPEAPLAITLRQEHYPFWATKVAPIMLGGLTLFAKPGDGTKPTITLGTAPTGDPSRKEHLLETSLGDLMMGALDAPLPPALGEVTLQLDDNSISDLWMVLTWSSQQ